MGWARGQFYFSLEERNRKGPMYMGGVSERLSPEALCLGVFIRILFPGWKEVGCFSVLLVHSGDIHLCQPMDMALALCMTPCPFPITLRSVHWLGILSGASSCAVHMPLAVSRLERAVSRFPILHTCLPQLPNLQQFQGLLHSIGFISAPLSVSHQGPLPSSSWSVSNSLLPFSLWSFSFLFQNSWDYRYVPQYPSLYFSFW
jgi:hypothetical protein